MKTALITAMLASLLALTACTVTLTTPTPGAGEPAETPATTAALALASTWEPVACAALDVADIVAAVADCGYITVPEKRGASGVALGDKFIRLGVVRLRTTAENPGAPIIVGTGGPGGDGLLFLNSAYGTSVNLPALYAPVLADRDLVYFTQRGTKGAKPELYCPEFDAVGYNAARNGWSQAEREAQYAATVQACADAFVAQGVDFSAYTSDENAADINDLRLALGYDKIIYYGQSYGTLLGQFFMRNFPETLEAVILDGTQPAQYTTYAQAFDVPASFQRLFAACAADAACNANYPDLEATLAASMAEFRASPKAVTVTGSDGVTQTFLLDDVAIMGGLFGKMYNGSATLPADIYHLKTDDPTFLAEFIPTPGGPIAKMMHFAVNCADDPNRTIDEFGFDAMAPLYAAFARDDAMQQVQACAILQTPQLPDASDAPVTSELPVLLLNGGLDPATAPENARLVETELPNSQYVLFPGGGHVQAQNPCAVAIIAAFAADPTAPVDTSCIAPAPVFATPITASVTGDDGAATITMTLPAGFAPVSPGQWLSAQTLIFLRVFPVGTTVADALKAAVETTAQPYDAAQGIDGGLVAGQPTQVYRGQVELGGAPFAFDFIAFANEAGAYVVQAYQGNASIVEAYRQGTLPALLATVTVTE